MTIKRARMDSNNGMASIFFLMFYCCLVHGCVRLGSMLGSVCITHTCDENDR